MKIRNQDQIFSHRQDNAAWPEAAVEGTTLHGQEQRSGAVVALLPSAPQEVLVSEISADDEQQILCGHHGLQTGIVLKLLGSH